MKKLAIIMVVLVAMCATAQEKQGPMRGGNRPMPPMRGPMMQQSGIWVTRMLSSKHGLERIGVTDPALCDKIIAAMAPLKEKGDALEQKIRALAREQAELTRGLLEDKTREPKPVMEKIDEVARLRAKQGKLSVNALLILRDNLPPEQLAKAKSMILERGRERMFGAGPRGEGHEGMRRGPRGEEGRKHGNFRRRGDKGRDEGGKKRAAKNDEANTME